MTSLLVAGVAVLDFVFHINSFPRAAEKYRAEDASIVGGGNAANAAVAIARLGGDAHLAARLGEDEIAGLILSGLELEGVNTKLTRRFETHRSSFSSIFVDGSGERQIMNYRDNNLSMDAAWLTEMLPETFDAALADTRWPDGARVAMEAAQKRGVPGIMDAEAPVLEAKDAIFAASHVAFSAQGVADLTGIGDVEQAALEADRFVPGKVIVTDGANGAVCIESGTPVRYPAFKVNAVDTLGAGDVWHGAFALALGNGRSEADAIGYANAAAAIKCTRRGGRKGAPSHDEVTQFLLNAKEALP